MNIGDDVTISGTIYDIRRRFSEGTDIYIRTSSGDILCIREEDIKTVRPYQPRPETDRRTGN